MNAELKKQKNTAFIFERRKNAFLLLAGERMGRRGGEKRLKRVNVGKEMGRIKAKERRKENGWIWKRIKEKGKNVRNEGWNALRMDGWQK